MTGNLLEINDLKSYFFTSRGIVKAVDSVSFHVSEKEAVGLVGESGCGKSTVAFTIAGLLPNPGRTVGGRVLFKGRDLLLLAETDMRPLRGTEIGVIFQDPMTFLNPIMKVGDQISERLTEHLHMTTGEAKTRAAELLAAVQIPLPARIIEYYPHQLSGGMRQRVLIAMAIACNPTLLIADEPTTALDTTVQAQIIKLMKELREKLNTTLLLITHDLGVVAEICDRVCVMYAGKIVEIGDVYTIFRNPMHPYTVGLLKSVLRVGKRRKTLLTIEGSVPDLTNPPNACRFHPRCSKALAVCREREPSMIEAEPRHYVNCWLYGRD